MLKKKKHSKKCAIETWCPSICMRKVDAIENKSSVILFKAGKKGLRCCCFSVYYQYLLTCVISVDGIDTQSSLIFQSNTKGGSSCLNEDTLGSQLKSGIAQYIALEIARGNGRDHRAITRYLPWLYHPPSTMQQGSVPVLSCSHCPAKTKVV